MYQIYNYRKKRVRTDYIILCHSLDLIKESIYINPIVLKGNYKYTWGIFQNYWIRNINKRALPCHYFVELLDKDYVIYNGLPEFKPSYYIEDLVKNNIIEYKYKNSILIVMQENLNIEPPELRMFDHVCDKLLAELVKRYHLDWTRIKTLDECLTLDWSEQLKLSNIDYKITKMKYLDKLKLKLSYNKYCNYS